ncbi:uncharacterized protein NEMAJ01_1264 [Nematocida major]|uniref:uncharacterized protein n=1 Tax=Nematocida major TaxID=1912982 RepID=UPI0020079524|nr:uncharacterized protein NEMAJ01_1264 [Nematocida major]KAH9386368.1 hypothetical protein NEMAJ01_1264 [Nematocida major]
MRLTGSLGIILALGGVMAEAEYLNQELDAISSGKKSLTMGSSAAPIGRGVGPAQAPDNDNDQENDVQVIRKLSKNQMNLVNNWANVQKADDVADKFGLQVGIRVTVWVPRNGGFNFSSIGPNTKIEMINEFVNMLQTLQADSADAMYTTMPAEYRAWSNSKNQAPPASKTKTMKSAAVSSDLSSNNRSSPKGRSSLSSVEESVVEEEED